jgi:CopG antitoxin of type II toxin-antitoxin system
MFAGFFLVERNALHAQKGRQSIMQRPTRLKKLPAFKSDREGERFVDDADLSQYDLSGGEFVRFERKPTDTSVTRVAHTPPKPRSSS